MQNSKTTAHQLISKTTTNKFTPVHQFISSIQSTGNLMSRAVVNRGAGDTSPEETNGYQWRKSDRSPEDNKTIRSQSIGHQRSQGRQFAAVQRITKGPMNSVSPLTLAAQEFGKIHQISSALDAANELVCGSELVHCCFANERVFLNSTFFVCLFAYFIFCVLFCFFILHIYLLFSLVSVFFICIFYILLHFKLIIVKLLYVFNLVQSNLI